MKIVCVEWMDAALHPDWARTHDEANVLPVETVGFLLYEDARVLKVVQSTCGDNRLSAIQSIPKPVVLRVTTLTARGRNRAKN